MLGHKKTTARRGCKNLDSMSTKKEKASDSGSGPLHHHLKLSRLLLQHRRINYKKGRAYSIYYAILKYRAIETRV
jgi:hypothetical protein